MCFGTLIGTAYGHLSLLPLIREKVLFFFGKEPVSLVPKECWLLSRGYSRIWGNGVSFEPENLHRTWPCHLYHVTPNYQTRRRQGEKCVRMYVYMMCVYIHIRRHMHVQAHVCVHVCMGP